MSLPPIPYTKLLQALSKGTSMSLMCFLCTLGIPTDRSYAGCFPVMQLEGKRIEKIFSAGNWGVGCGWGGRIADDPRIVLCICTDSLWLCEITCLHWGLAFAPGQRRGIKPERKGKTSLRRSEGEVEESREKSIAEPEAAAGSRPGRLQWGPAFSRGQQGSCGGRTDGRTGGWNCCCCGVRKPGTWHSLLIISVH